MLKKITSALIVLCIACAAMPAFSQGCVAIRNLPSGSCGGNDPAIDSMKAGQFTLGFGYRYFKSFRHFSGNVENVDRQLAGNSEVINYSNTFTLSGAITLPKRFVFTFNIPFVDNIRSSQYEHGLTLRGWVLENGVKARHSTFSSGLSDISVGLQYWIFNPAKNKNGNLMIGLGAHLPTGNANAQGMWYNVGPNGTAAMRTVDQSIQPGDGGFGFNLEVNAWHKLSKTFITYFQGYYLFNPRNKNTSYTFRDSLSKALANESVMSVPDQYMIRGGFTYLLPIHGLAFSSGVRMEGIPVYDALGKSDGFRRPGYIVSYEPAVSYMYKRFTASVFLPIAIVRNRQQSVTDKENTIKTGKFTRGDAAFSDWALMANFSYRFGK
jgi:hypothetical protein